MRNIIHLWLFLGTLCLSASANADNKIELIVANDGLIEKVKLTKARVKARGTLKMGDVEVKNLSSERLVLEYRFDWLDEDGFGVSESGIWQRFDLGAGDVRSFKSMAKSKEATTFRLVVRYIDDSIIRNTQ